MRRILLLCICCCVTVAFAQQEPGRPPITAAPPPAEAQVAPPSPNMSASDLEQAGDTLRERKQFLDAIDYYKAEIKKQPRNAVAWNKKGIAELQASKLKDAERSFKRSIKFDKKYPDPLNNLGVVRYRQKKLEAAADMYRRAIKLQDSASYHSNLGTAYFEMHDIPRALAEYQQALALDPAIFDRTSQAGVAARLSSPEDRAQFSYVLARMYAKAGNFDRSLFFLRRAIEDGYKKVNDAYKDDEFANLRKDPRFGELMGANRPVSVSQ